MQWIIVRGCYGGLLTEMVVSVKILTQCLYKFLTKWKGISGMTARGKKIREIKTLDKNLTKRIINWGENKAIKEGKKYQVTFYVWLN